MAKKLDIRYPPPPITWPFLFYEDWQSGLMDVWTHSPVLVSIGALGIIGLILQKLTNSAPCGSTFLRLTVLFPPATLKHGEFWRFLTHIFLHSDVLHLLLNLVMLCFALDLEGLPRTIAYSSETPPIYVGSLNVIWVVAVSAFSSGLGASIFTFQGMIEGLSGVCFGLQGAIMGLCMIGIGYNTSGRYAPALRGRLYYACMWLVFDVIRTLLVMMAGNGSTIGFAGHLFGFIGGIIAVSLAAWVKLPCQYDSLSILPSSGTCVAFAGIPFLDEKRFVLPTETAQFYAVCVLAVLLAIALFNAHVIFSQTRGSEGGISLQCCCTDDAAAARNNYRLHNNNNNNNNNNNSNH